MKRKPNKPLVEARKKQSARRPLYRASGAVTGYKLKQAYEVLAPRLAIAPPGKNTEIVAPRAVKTSRMGRPPSYLIDWEVVYKMACVQITPEEMSWILEVPHSWLTQQPDFPRIYQKGWNQMKASLRRMQWRKAVAQSKSGGDSNSNMLIFLGKQILGQRDRVYHEHEGPDGAPIPIRTERQDLKLLSVPELEQLKALIQKATLPEEEAG